MFRLFSARTTFPDEYRERREEYVALVIEEMLPRVADEGLAEYCDVFCEESVFTLEESRRILTAARQLGLGLRLHADQLSLSGGALWRRSSGRRRPIIWSTRMPTASRRLKAANVQPVLLPGSVYALGSARYPAAREMIEAGSRRRARHGFQSRLIADAIDADGALARFDASEDDARRKPDRRDHQRCLQSRTGRGTRLARSGQARRFCHP